MSPFEAANSSIGAVSSIDLKLYEKQCMRFMSCKWQIECCVKGAYRGALEMFNECASSAKEEYVCDVRNNLFSCTCTVYIHNFGYASAG